MKTIKNLLLGLFVLTLMFTTNSFAQEEEKKEEFKPVYITVTTAHRSADPDVDYSDWMKTEKEYFDKVTMKNDLILNSGFYFHYFTPDDSELKLVSVYKTWGDIEKSNDINNKLIEEGWPNEEERKAFFEKQSSYYSPDHSDEIYSSLPFTKPLKSDSEKPLIFYVKVNKTGEGGSGFKEYFENVTQKNTHIKGYYTHRHLWGADSREAVEVFVLESLADIEKAFEEDTKLINEHWPDEEKRKEFFKGFSKLFAGHGDFILTNVPELSK